MTTQKTPYSKYIHPHLVLSAANMVADDRAEKQTNKKNAKFQKSRLTMRPNRSFVIREN
jgi:hypothetical protein